MNNLDISLSYNYGTGTKDPTPTSGSSGFHGTACAGIVGAQGYNSGGVRGVAPMTRLSGLNIFATSSTWSIEDALDRSGIDIFSNSWGPVSSSYLTDWGEGITGALADGAVYGRDGKGAVYVFAAGNDRTSTHEGYANTSNLQNSKYVITVSSVNAFGKLSSYSNTGANILVAGTGGEYGITYPAVVTTDLTGVGVGDDTLYDLDGNPIANSSLGGDNPDGNYTRFMNGTSAACPSVSGIVALMLQVNPELTRRDVKHILAYTARKNDTGDSGWSLNGAGLHINDKYGFGFADAGAAVAMSENFPSLGTEIVTPLYSDVLTNPVMIPDGNVTGVTRSIDINESVTVENVDVWVNTEHPYIDDLRIVLISPDGTQSVLAVGGENFIPRWESYDDWRFSTVRCMGENSHGTWQLKVIDTKTGNDGSLIDWRIQISGH